MMKLFQCLLLMHLCYVGLTQYYSNYGEDSLDGNEEDEPVVHDNRRRSAMNKEQIQDLLWDFQSDVVQSNNVLTIDAKRSRSSAWKDSQKWNLDDGIQSDQPRVETTLSSKENSTQNNKKDSITKRHDLQPETTEKNQESIGQSNNSNNSNPNNSSSIRPPEQPNRRFEWNSNRNQDPRQFYSNRGNDNSRNFVARAQDPNKPQYPNQWQDPRFPIRPQDPYRTSYQYSGDRNPDQRERYPTSYNMNASQLLPNTPERSLQSGPPKPWTCQFQFNQNCGLTNDKSIGEIFQLRQENFFQNQNFNWPMWYLLLNTSTVPANKIGGRLITSYFATHNQPSGCLSLSYIVTGMDIEKMIIYQQDSDNHCLWTHQFPPSMSPSTKTVDLTINLKNGEPRFFIEAHLKNHDFVHSSVLALSNVRMSYQPCAQDQSNQCRVGAVASPSEQP